MGLGIFPYIFVFFIGCYNVFKDTRKSNNFFFFMLFLLGALRQDVGFDYMAYDALIEAGKGFSVDRIEPIERWLIKISHNYFHQLFFIVNSFITVYFTKWALDRESRDVSISALAFLCFPLMLTNSFSIIRFWSALSIIFYGSTFLKERKYVVFGICAFVALGFHMSAIIAVLFIPLYLFHVPLVLNILILTISFFGGEFVLSKILSGVLPDNIFAERLTLYANKDGADGLSKIPYLYLALDIYFLILYAKTHDYKREGYLWVTIYNIGVSFMFLLSFQTTLAARLSRPFMLYILFLLPNAIKFSPIGKKYYNVQIHQFIFCIICLILFIYLLTIYNDYLDRSQYLPYKLFL